MVGWGIPRRFAAVPRFASTQRTNIRNPGWSPTTVMCPLQGELARKEASSPSDLEALKTSNLEFTEYPRLSKWCAIGNPGIKLGTRRSPVRTGEKTH